MKNDDLEKAFKSIRQQQDETIAMLADATWHATIGQHVEMLLKESGELSLEALRSSLDAASAGSAPECIVAAEAKAKLEAIIKQTP